MGIELFFYAVMTIASYMYQKQQAKKMKARMDALQKESDARADAAKGIQFSVEGQSSPLYVAYGRNIAAGVRVYHNTFDNIVDYGPSAGGVSFSNLVNKMVPAEEGDSSNKGMRPKFNGRKHEFLLVQQAITYSGFSSCGGLLVDSKLWSEWPESIRCHVYPSGGIVDSMSVVDYDRKDAYFTNVGYASTMFWLNREDPQFSGPPECQFFIEGLAVEDIATDGVNYWVTAKSYSSNPARCLLNYLLNNKYGLGLTTNKVDLKSFYKAKNLCNIIVGEVTNRGRWWESYANLGATRLLRRFECHIPISTSNNIRDNIEKFLECMDMAELIWSEGQYKLQLSYPTEYNATESYIPGDVVQYQDTAYTFDLFECIVANTGVPVSNTNYWKRGCAAYVDDNNIIMGKEFSAIWPNAQSRYNSVTVRFRNEAKEFSEDTVTWPPKTSSVYHDMLVEDNGLPLETELYEEGIIDYWHALARAEHRCRLSRYSTNYTFTVSASFSAIEPGDIIRLESLSYNVPGQLILIEEGKLVEDNSVELQGFAFDARILAWNANDDEYVKPLVIPNTELPQVTNLQYYNNIQTFNGTVGTLQWTRPSDNRVSGYLVKATPVPISLINSDTLWMDLGFTVNNWLDIPAFTAGNYVLTAVSQAIGGKQAPKNSPITGSRWPLISVGISSVVVDGVVFYSVQIFTRSAAVPDTPIGGTFDFRQLGLTTTPPGWGVTIPSNSSDTVWFSRATARSSNGQEDSNLTWSIPMALASGNPTYATIIPSGVSVLRNEIGENYGYDNANGQFFAIRNNVDISTSPDSVYSVVSTDNCQVDINEDGWFQVGSLIGTSGSAKLRVIFDNTTFEETLAVFALGFGYTKDLTPPPAPENVDIRVGFTTVFMETPVHTYTEGHGHQLTIIYGKYQELDTLDPLPTFEECEALGSFRGTIFGFASVLGSKLTLYFKNFSIDGVESIGYFGPVDGTTGKIGTNDLNDYIIEAEKLAKNSVTEVAILKDSITAPKIAANAIAVGTLAVQDGAIRNAMIESLVADKILTGSLQAATDITAGGKLKISGGGWIETYSAEGYSRDADYSRMASSEIALYRWISALAQSIRYTYLNRTEYGYAQSGHRVYIPGYWKRQPNIVTAINSMEFYKAAYGNQDQKILCYHEDLREDPAGSSRWSFLAKADLVLAAGNYAAVINEVANTSADAWYSSNVSTAANTTYISVNASFFSLRGAGAQGTLAYRAVRWRVEYWNGSSWVPSGFREVHFGASTSGSWNDTAYVTLPYAGAWTFRIYCEAFDAGGTFGGVNYTYYEDNHSPANKYDSYRLSLGANTINGTTGNSGTRYANLGSLGYTGAEFVSCRYIYDLECGLFDFLTVAQSSSESPSHYYSPPSEVTHRVYLDAAAVNSFSYNPVGTGQIIAAGGTTKTLPIASGGKYDVRESMGHVDFTEATYNPNRISYSFYNTLRAMPYTVNDARVISSFLNVYNIHLIFSSRTINATNPTPANKFGLMSYGSNLAQATVLASGTLEWVAVGD